MEMYQLRHLVAVIEHGNISRAARSLNVSQPAVTISLNKLREELGVKLLQRIANGVVPTEYGEAVGLHAQAMLRQQNRIKSDVTAMQQGRRRPVVLGLSDNPVNFIIPEVVKRWRNSHPDISLSVDQDSHENMIAKIRAAEVDFSFSALRQSPLGDDLVSETLMNDKMSLYVASDHWVAWKKKLKVEDIAALDWAVLGLGETAQIFINAHFTLKGFSPPTIKFKTNSLSLLRHTVMQSDLVGIVPRYLMDDEIYHGHVVRLSVSDLEFFSQVGLIFDKSRQLTDSQEAVCNLIREVCKGH